MEEKIGFGKTALGMLKGLIKPQAYADTAKKTSWFNVNLLIIIVSLVLPFAVFFIPAMITVGNGKLADKVDEEIAYFSIDEDGFYCEKEYEWKSDSDYYICVNTSDNYVEDDEMEELLAEGNYNTVVIATAKEVLFYSDEDTTSIYKWSTVYDDLRNIEERNVYDKTYLVSFIRKYDTPVLIVAYIILATACLLVYYIADILWGLVGMLIRHMMKSEKEISNSDLMKMAMLIRTPWFIIVVLAICLIFKNSIFITFLIGVLIEFNYLMLAINSLKTKTD